MFTLIDVFRRECLALRVARRFTGSDVAALLAEVGTARGGHASAVQCDNGTEFMATALDHWAYWSKVQLDFSRPGKPVDNGVCEAYNGSVRRECLSQHWFASLEEAQVHLERWRTEYNNERPHSSLGHLSPASFGGAGIYLHAA